MLLGVVLDSIIPRCLFSRRGLTRKGLTAPSLRATDWPSEMAESIQEIGAVS